MSDNGHNQLGFVYVVHHEEPSIVDDEVYVFVDRESAERFAEDRARYVTEEPVLDMAFVHETEEDAGKEN